MVDNKIVDGISLTDTDVPFCEMYVKAKQTTKPFPQERSSPPMTAYGQRVHSDVWGKASVKSLGGNEYFVTFLDDYSDEAMVVPMKKKSEVFDRFKEYEALLKRQRGVDGIKELQSNRGSKYTSNEFTEHLKKQGTVRQLTTHDSPQQNGKAERLNLTLVEHSRCMLLNSGLPKFLWAEAVKHAAYLRNRTTTKTTLGSTPHERATKTKPNLGRIPRFGQEVLVLIDAASKLDPTSKTARWIGFDDESKGHKVYWPDKRSVSVERNLTFVPDSSPEVVVLPEGENRTHSSQNAPSVSKTSTATVPKPSPSIANTSVSANLSPKAKIEPLSSSLPPPDQGESVKIRLGVTKVRYGDRPDFRSTECGGPVCRVALIQTGLASTYVLRPSKTRHWISDGVSTTDYGGGVRSTEGHWERRKDFTQIGVVNLRISKPTS